jgi:hypothetical protein
MSYTEGGHRSLNCGGSIVCEHTEIHYTTLQPISVNVNVFTSQHSRQVYWLAQIRTEDTFPESKVGSVVFIHIALKFLYFRLSAYKPSACKPTLNKCLSMLADQCWLFVTFEPVPKIYLTEV